jgi:hypothetical protein
MLSPIIKKLLRKSNQPLQKMINCLMNCFHIDAASKKILYDTREYRFKLQHDTALFFPFQLHLQKNTRNASLVSQLYKEPSNCVHVKDLSVIFILNIFSNERGDFIYGLRYRQTGNIYTYSIPSTSYYVRVGRLLNDSLQ